MDKMTKLNLDCETRNICESGQCASQRVMRAMVASHGCESCEPAWQAACESACESHSYWKITVLKWVLRLKNCLSALFEMGANI